MVKPLRNSYEQFTTVVTEVANSVIFLEASLFAFDMGESARKWVDTAGVVTVLCSLTVSAFLSMTKTVLVIRDVCRLYRRTTVRLHNKKSMHLIRLTKSPKVSPVS